MKKSMLKVLMVLALGAVILMPGMSGAAYVTYTTEAAFTSAIASYSYYLEEFQSMPFGTLLPATQPYGPVNGFSYDAYAANGLMIGKESASVDNRDLTTQLADPIVFTFTGFPVYAFGGQFFPSDYLTYDTTGPAYLTIGGDTITLNYDTLWDRPFLGIISDTPLTSVSIAPDFETGNYIAADHVYVGSAVPVPPSVLLLGSGLLGLVGWRRFRKSY